MFDDIGREVKKETSCQEFRASVLPFNGYEDCACSVNLFFASIPTFLKSERKNS